MKGPYLVFEGVDGSGKSTAMRAVHQELLRLGHDVISTRHPGATPLGAQLRRLTKYPESVDEKIQLDPLSTQLMMVADAANFEAIILTPAVNAGKVVLADRSNAMSMLAYGAADGLALSKLKQLLSLVSMPLADRLYVFHCPLEVSQRRLRAQNGGDATGLDRFERMGAEFFARVHAVYRDLLDPDLLPLTRMSVGAENVKYINADRDPEAVAFEVLADVLGVLLSRGLGQPE